MRDKKGNSILARRRRDAGNSGKTGMKDEGLRIAVRASSLKTPPAPQRLE